MRTADSPPASTEVSLGPLPARAVHFVAPVIFVLLATCLGGAGVVVVLEGRGIGPSLCGAVFGVALVSIAVHWTVVALGRRRVRTVVVTPTSIDPAGGAPLPRVAPEAVTIVSVVRGGRGSYPVWAIDYGNRDHAVRLGTWMSFRGPAELEPFADALRRALGIS